MSFLGNFAARCAQAWLDRFRKHHGLSNRLDHSSRDSFPWLRSSDAERLLLHVGCGGARMDQIPVAGFRFPGWREVRLDADATVLPDIVGSMTDMAAVPDEAVDAVFSSHGIEHLFWHDVPSALAEFHRVLRNQGFLVVTCPDLQAAARMIAEDRLFDVAYVSPAGPITAFDMVYSYRPFVEANPEWMSHRCGFTLSTLVASLRDVGFAAVHGVRRESGFDLWVVASKSSRSAEEMAALASEYLAYC